MKQVTILSPTHNEELEKALLCKNYSKPVLVRMGSCANYVRRGEPYIEINKQISVLNSLDRYSVRLILYKAGLSIPRTYDRLEDIGYPHILKSSEKIHGREGVMYIENATDYKMAKAIMKGNKAGYLLQQVIPLAKEYRIFCTKEKIFLILERVSDDSEAKILTQDNSHFVIVKPTLFLKSVSLYLLQAMKLLHLDIAAIDILLYTSMGTTMYFILKATTNPILNEETLPIYVDNLDILIRKELN